ncbi:hypothetical protein FRC11_014809 [Ceratobasidium sp. 423]|nr:hypothetical protein FRC11_014809 [Ceratobasidium sp. 423]
MFDELFTDLRRLGSPIFLHEWYKDPPALVNVCFQSGRISPELCFVETSGRIRIFSLKTQMFRGAELKLGRPVSDAFPAPDGSCLLVIIAGATISSPDKLLAFHWESFDQNQPGINCADLPLSEVSRAATRFNGRGRIHVVSFGSQDKAVTSTALEVKQKASEFFVRSDQESSPQPLPATSNNGLIDCHMEAWTRFPVVPAVTRSTLSALARKPRRLTFVSSVPLPEVVEYYASMIVQFKNTTQKPVDAELDAIAVSSQSSMDAESGLHANTSEFRLGSFIVELLCLIPLHLAITMNNKFMPLKDGVWDPEHERKLVGATISELIDSLSLGWYESLLQSYMATKSFEPMTEGDSQPVRVVSSMGEQSVGQSSKICRL